MATFFLSSFGCAIEDGTAFGQPYSIAAEPAPRIDADELVFTATYASACAEDVSTFDVERFGEDKAAAPGAPAILSQTVMLVAVRHEPQCASPLPFSQDVTHEVRAPLPASALGFGVDSMLACPPGSTYEMVKLSAAPPAGAGMPSFMAGRASAPAAKATKPADWDEEEDGPWEDGEAPAAVGSFLGKAKGKDERTGADDPEEEAARVAEELATQTPEDSVAFLAHCEEKEASGEPCSCCTPHMMSELRKKIAFERHDAAEGAANASADADAETLPTIAASVDALGLAAAAVVS